MYQKIDLNRKYGYSISVKTRKCKWRTWILVGDSEQIWFL